jgi:ribonuclease T1
MTVKVFRNWLFGLLSLLLVVTAQARSGSALPEVRADDLPREAQKTLVLIRRGGPFPYSKDGVVFGNYEGLLPKQKRGYYHEFTVKTEGMRNRGPRRIIVGGEPAVSEDFYYTDDHYATFKRIRMPAPEGLHVGKPR